METTASNYKSIKTVSAIENLLSSLQRTVKVPKNQRNSFGNYNYRSCEDIVEAIKPLLPKEALLILNDEIVQIGDRFYVKATASLFYKEKQISATAYARESLTKKGMDESQITGATSSYARKYALNGLFAIDDTKDADTQDNTEKKEAPKVVAKPTDPRKAKIKQLLEDLGHYPKTAKEASDILFELTTNVYVEKSYDDIISKLTILVEEKDAKTEEEINNIGK
jgi:hypothetical protein